MPSKSLLSTVSLAVAVLLNLSAKAAASAIPNQAASCSWGYKPSASSLIGTAQQLQGGYDHMLDRSEWEVLADESTPSGLYTTPFRLTEYKDETLVVEKNVDDQQEKYVMTFGLTGVLPPEAVAKGATGNKWDMFLYINNKHATSCTFPGFKLDIASVSVQKIR